MRSLTTLLFLLTTSPAFALTAGNIDNATFDGKSLPDGQSAVTTKLQILLDRAGVSPGVIDGYVGGMSESAIRGFEAREGLPVDGKIDPEVWKALGGDTATALTQSYTVTQEDIDALVSEIPDNVREKSKMESLGYTSVTESLAERFHMDEDFLKLLNPESVFKAGDTVAVIDPGSRLEAAVSRIEVRKSDRRAVAFDTEGNIVADYPVAIGSDETPSPEGTLEVTAIAMEPTYSYRPDVNFEADGVKEALTLPPGPNGPVGAVWIDLSKDTYGLHGTDTPAELFSAASHGCVRFTNWDVTELAYLVSPGVTVEFIE